MVTYTLRVDGKYDLLQWCEDWTPDLHWDLWHLGILRYGENFQIVDKWVKVYEGRKLAATYMVPAGATERRDEFGERRCCR